MSELTEKSFIKRYMFTIGFIISAVVVVTGVIFAILTELYIIGLGTLVWIFPAWVSLKGLLKFEWG